MRVFFIVAFESECKSTWFLNKQKILNQIILFILIILCILRIYSESQICWCAYSYQGSPHLQTRLLDGFCLTFSWLFSYISFTFFIFPVHPTGFSFCFFSGFLAIFTLISSNNNNCFSVLVLQLVWNSNSQAQDYREILFSVSESV